jgi:hypothetical protein
MAIRIRYMGLAAAIAMGALSLGTAVAHRPPAISTKLQIGLPTAITNAPNEFDLSASGPLSSSKSKCVASRTVKLFFKSGHAKTLVDVDTTSRNGQWGVSGRARSHPDAFVVKVTPKRVEVHHHARICEADQVLRKVTVVQPV